MELKEGALQRLCVRGAGPLNAPRRGPVPLSPPPKASTRQETAVPPVSRGSGLKGIGSGSPIPAASQLRQRSRSKEWSPLAGHEVRARGTKECYPAPVRALEGTPSLER